MYVIPSSLFFLLVIIGLSNPGPYSIYGIFFFVHGRVATKNLENWNRKIAAARYTRSNVNIGKLNFTHSVETGISLSINQAKSLRNFVAINKWHREQIEVINRDRGGGRGTLAPISTRKREIV